MPNIGTGRPRLALGNRRPLYNLLFHTAWAALKQMLTDGKHLGIDPAAAMVLHTWDQHLAHHAHVHAIVPAGGPSVDGTRWIGCRRSRKTGKLYLVSNKALGRLFRGKFLAGLKRLWRRGELKLDGQWSRLLDESSWEQWLSPLYSQDWVVNIQAPILPAQPICPQCGNLLTLVATRERPSWCELFAQPHSPPHWQEDSW